MIGVGSLAPSRVTPVSISTMSRSTRGRSFSRRHASDVFLDGDLVVGAGVAEYPRCRRHHPPGILLQRIEIDAIDQHFLLPRGGLSRRLMSSSPKCAVPARAAVAGFGISIVGSFPWPPPVRLPPTSARPSANCTNPAASSFPIPGTSAARAICRAWASRRWRPPAPATPIPRAMPTALSPSTRCWRITASLRRRPTCRSTPISRTDSRTIRTRLPPT